MAVNCVNLTILGGGAAEAASRELAGATASIDTQQVDEAVAKALDQAAPDHDSTEDIEAIADAVTNLSPTVTHGDLSYDVSVIWNEKVTSKNILKDALREAIRMVESDNRLSD